MIAQDHINRLWMFIENLESKENEYSNLTPKEYKRQLDYYFETETENIIKDINRDLEHLSKEDDESLKDGLKGLVPKVETLLANVNGLAISEEEDERAQIRSAFYECLQAFLRNLIQKVEEISEGALTNEEINNCHFDNLLPKITIDHLEQIYDNLKANHWICSRHTSMGDFIYYFSGQGFRPTEKIHWKVSTAKLTLFLVEVVADENVWAKASHIFLVRNKSVGKKVLGNTFSRCRNRDSDKSDELIREIERKITHVEQRPKPFWME